MPYTFKSSESGIAHGRRRFHDIPLCSQKKTSEVDVAKLKEETTKLLQFISEDIVGKKHSFSGPYGIREIVYCDYIASGRALNSIESYVKEHILPVYGNTHTTTSVTSLQSTMFQQEARTMIRNAVRASEHDAVIFTGNGVTSAVHKLIHALNFEHPPVVFVGPYEHHSNLLPWREVAAHVVPISESMDGNVNVTHLEMALKEWQGTGLEMIGCFSAASNVTGILVDTITISAVLHKYGALAFWDYATAGPYVDIDMHPLSNSNASKDAIFLSMHKFVGGVDAPGVLVGKRSLFRSNVPSGGGGGSVFFVSRGSHRYLQDEEMREEGGTPRVVGIVRAALAMDLKQSVGSDNIEKLEKQFYMEAMKQWETCSNLHVLGNDASEGSIRDHLSVFSFMIHHSSSKKYLHHNYVASLLNDLFGIQARGGCACAGPYAQNLLGIDEDLALEFEKALLEDSRLDRVHLRRKTEYSPHEVLRPGFVRLNIPYFANAELRSFIIRAVAMVAEHGWKLLPQYMFNPETGEWHHTRHKIFSDRRWLGNVRFSSQGLRVVNEVEDRASSLTYDDVIMAAEEILKNPLKGYETSLPDHRLMFSEDIQHLRWFLLPSEAQGLLLGKVSASPECNCVISVRKLIKEYRTDELNELVKVPDHITSQVLDANSKNNKEKTSGIEGNVSLPIVCTSSNSQFTFDETNKETIDTFSNKLSISTSDVGKSCKLFPSTSSSKNGKSCFTKTRCTKNGDISLSKDVKFVSPPKRLFKLTAEAIKHYKMIENNDRVLVCLSGGKDSLSLLHVLHQYQFYAKGKGINFQLGAVTIDPMTSAYDPSPLIPYLKSLGVTYFYEEQDILDQALKVSASSICSFCSRMKRGRIYACARREGWNVLAFGQHLDDLAESFLMSSFHNGLLRTMKANYTVKEGDLRVIRPFVYVRETDTRSFAESSHLPVIPENCPACFEAPKERHRMKQLLASQEILHPRLFHSLKEAIMPLMAKNRTGLESTHHNNSHVISDIDDDSCYSAIKLQ